MWDMKTMKMMNLNSMFKVCVKNTAANFNSSFLQKLIYLLRFFASLQNHFFNSLKIDIFFTVKKQGIKYFAFAFCLLVFGGQYLFSSEKASRSDMKIICPDSDFGKPISEPIFHIEIYEHDVLVQAIEYSYQDTFMLEKHFDLLDVNFDGHDDIVILAGLTANRGQKYYDAYIWNPRQNKFILHDGIRNVINMKIDGAQKLIYSSYMLNGGRTEYYVYSFVGDKLVEIDCMMQQEKNGNKRYSKSVFSDVSLEYDALPSFWKNVINLYD